MITKWINRRHKLGVGWRYAPDTPEVPDYIGTIKQVADMLDCDRTYHNHGDAWINVQWFMRLNGRWVKIKLADEAWQTSILQLAEDYLAVQVTLVD